MKTIDHIAVLVENLDVSQQWYEKYCGAELIFSDNKYKRMKMNNTTIALIDKKHYKYAHIGIPVANYADLPSDKGEMVHHRDGTTGCYVKDPDGNMIEFIHYNEDCKKKMGIEE
mgnify:CR=1 FL=1